MLLEREHGMQLVAAYNLTNYIVRQQGPTDKGSRQTNVFRRQKWLVLLSKAKKEGSVCACRKTKKFSCHICQLDSKLSEVSVLAAEKDGH